MEFVHLVRLLVTGIRGEVVFHSGGLLHPLHRNLSLAPVLCRLDDDDVS
jgi:hypothetical protein